MSDHWFDRLATPHTRRNGFKLALAGALGTLPLVRSATSEAAVPSCTKPCLYVAQVEKGGNYDKCTGQFASSYFSTLTSFFTPAVLIFPQLAAKDVTTKIKCDEQVRVRHKAAHFDCIKDGSCGGFDAQKNKDVLCPGCTEVGGKCCPAPSVGTTSGYVCCGACCADNGDGCKAPC